MSEKRPYHHGDLRRVIVETAEQMLDESRGWQFTLREVARRADVSHAAPYRHFPDKAALLVELALRGFDQLNRDMVAALAQASAEPSSCLPSPRAAFKAVALAYITFGEKNPSLYRLMFSSEAGDPRTTHLDERAMAALDVVERLLVQGQQAGVFKPQAVRSQATACWAQVHGITMLSIEGMLMPEKVGEAPVEAALDILLDGLVA